MKIKRIIILLGLLITGLFINAQNCPSYFSYANSANYKAGKYAPLFKKWRESFDSCVDTRFGKNILIDAQYIITAALDATPEGTPERKKMKEYLVKAFDKNIEKYPKEANYYKAFKTSYLKYYKIGAQEEWLKSYDEAFSSNPSDLPSSSMSDYFHLAQLMLSENKINFDKMLSVYNTIKSALDKNIERSNVEITKLETLDSIGSISKTEKASLSQKTGQRKAYIQSYEYVEGNIARLYTCDRVIPLYKSQYEAKQNDIKWLNEVRGTLLYKKCTQDTIFNEKIQAQYAKLYCAANPEKCKTNPTSENGAAKAVVIDDYNKGLILIQKRRYSKAAPILSEVANDASRTKKNRAQAAYYAAYSYLESGNLGKARSLAQKAASLRGGWGEPYFIIASAYAKGANNCGKSLFEKKSTYWFSADVARKAARIDPRVRSKANKIAADFEAAAPTKTDMFNAGVKPGQTVKTCYGKTIAR